MYGNLEELDAEFKLCEDVHAPQISDDAETGGQLDVGAQLVDQLVQHELAGGLHLTHDRLQEGSNKNTMCYTTSCAS